MSSKTLEGMIRKRSGYIIGHKDRSDQFAVEQEAMRVALLWLADNVSDEMVYAAVAPDVANMANFKIAFRGTIERARAEISAALRAAGDGR